MIPPQTPRMKTKLSLDTNFSNMATPSSPSSPQFSPCASPTLSGSWHMKSHAELTASLKEAYNMTHCYHFFSTLICTDLTLAAEIGKSLLENNIALKAKYEEIVMEYQQLQRKERSKATFALHAEKPNVVPIAPPSNSVIDESDPEDSDLEFRPLTSSFESSPQLYDRPDKLRNRKRSDQPVSYKDLENIKELERTNQLLQSQLDDLMKEHNDSDRTNKTKIRKLEADLQHYQEIYTSATHQLEVLEQENERLQKKQKSEFWTIKYNKKTSNDDDIIETLLAKVSELESQNNAIERTKTEIEKRLQRAVRDLEALQEQYNDISEQSKDYELLKVAHREQELLINELNESLEEQRAMIIGMRSNMYSRTPSRSNSFSYSDNGMMTNAIRRISNPDGVNSFGSATSPNSQQQNFSGKLRTTLLSELENVWFREASLFQRDRKKSISETSPAFSPISSEKDLANFFLNGSQPDDDISQLDYLSDDDFSFLDEFEEDDEMAMRKREWFWKRWARYVYRLLRLIWRWCRFIIILFCAVIMALYRGPDDILPSEM
ncbi:17933_t:CDS:2 [Cetraspora pellucida]|uniref:17933_t:CDS:1 n=1 Tax=Cetraspora pellucida TaxID=1433469 RepID=A0A9N9AL88_9GLOM|nr:17933_t:CDS:2 [Cetraspora pellucida]